MPACGTATPNIVVSFTPQPSTIAEGQGSLGRPTGLADDLPPPLIYGLAADMTPEPWTPTIAVSGGGVDGEHAPALTVRSPVPKETPFESGTPLTLTATVSAASTDHIPDATKMVTGTTLTEAEMDALLAAVSWPVETREAAKRVIRCESGFNPNATGRAGERGLLQIHPIHADSTYDPAGNLRAGLRISGGGYSWAAWSCKP